LQEASKLKFLFDALECSSIIHTDIPEKLKLLNLAKENLVTYLLGFEESTSGDTEICNNLNKVLSKELKPRAFVALIKAELGIFCVVLNLPATIIDSVELKKESMKIASLIKDALFCELKMTANIGVSHVFSGHNNLGLSYHEASSALDDRFYKMPGSITNVDDMYGLVLTETSSELISFIEATDYQSAHATLDRFYRFLEDNIEGTLHLYKRLSMNLLIEIYQFILETANGISTSEMTRIPVVCEMLEDASTFEGVYGIVDRYIEETINYLKRLRFKKYEVLVSRAISFIESNYMKNIGLTDVAQFLGISTSLFASVFKKNTNKNFVQFLGEYRIERAKKLLMSPDVKIQEVAALSGFNDDKYFYRIFKMHTGYTPTAYRKLIVSKELTSN
jgi:two-component system, response regulator YesN